MKFCIVKNNHVEDIPFALDGVPYIARAGEYIAVPKEMLPAAERAGRINPLKKSYISEVDTSEVSKAQLLALVKEKDDISFVETTLKDGYTAMFDGVMYSFEYGKKYLFDSTLAKKLIARAKSVVAGDMLRLYEPEAEPVSSKKKANAEKVEK